MLKKIKNHLKWIGIASALILILVVFSVIKQQSANGLPKDKESYTVKPTTVRSTLSLSGTVEAEEVATLQFQTSGRLSWVGIKEGDRVSKWQTLATLDQRELRKNLDKKLQDFLLTREDFDQTKDDYQGQETDDKNTYLTDEISRIVRASQYGLNKAVIDVELANLTLEVGSLFTPIDGIVTHIDQKVANTNITPATARIEIVNPDTLYLEATVDQQDVVKLTPNLKAEIVFDAFPDKVYWGKLYYISFAPSATEEDSYQIKFTLPQAVISKLRLKMAAEVSLVTNEVNNVLAVPFMAVSEENGKSIVSVLDEQGKVQKRPVTTGIESDELVEISTGLSPNEVVIY